MLPPLAPSSSAGQQEAQAHPRPTVDDEETIHRRIHLGLHFTEGGQFRLAQRCFTEALTLAQQHQLPRWEAQASHAQGMLLDRLGKPTEAVAHFERAAALFEQLAPSAWRSTCDSGLPTCSTRRASQQRH